MGARVDRGVIEEPMGWSPRSGAEYGRDVTASLPYPVKGHKREEGGAMLTVMAVVAGITLVAAGVYALAALIWGDLLEGKS